VEVAAVWPSTWRSEAAGRWGDAERADVYRLFDLRAEVFEAEANGDDVGELVAEIEEIEVRLRLRLPERPLPPDPRL